VTRSAAPLLLAGDVGGTKTILTALRPNDGSGAGGGAVAEAVAEATFDSRRYDALETIVDEFLDRAELKAHRGRVARASFSVAGPVASGRALLTNLGWQLDGERMRVAFGLESVDLVNDLQATAYAVPRLSASHLHTLQPGDPVADHPRAVIAPGTGLGEAFLVWDGGQWEALPSEGGNADFAPTTARQLELLRFLQPRIGHVSWELVCSGIGLPNVYRFLKETGAEPEPPWLAERLAAAADPTPVIADAALGPDAVPLCARTLELFVEILAGEAGNMALRLLSSGGVYIGGGIPPRILPLLRTERFLNAFRGKGRFEPLMTTFPVHVILEPRSALLGAVHYALARPTPHLEMPAGELGE
jgi:glucokinase